MKFLCSKKQLAEAFKAVSGLVSAKSTSLGNQGILMEAEKDQLILKASDNEVTAIHQMNGVKVEKPGVIMVDPVISNITTDLSEETLTLELSDEGNQVYLHGTGKEYEVPTMDPDEFRGLEGEKSGTTLVIKADVFKKAVERCSIAVAREASRYAFNGILLEVNKDGETFMVGSDGRRLSVVQLTTEEKLKDVVCSLIPKRALVDFLKVLPPSGETIKLILSQDRMHLDLGKTMVFAQIIDGEYPDYMQVIPRETTNRVVIPTESLEKALRRILFVSSNEAPIAKLNFYSHGELEIQSGCGDKAGKESIEVQLDGKGGDISFNPQYVIDYLKVCGMETVTLHFSDNQVPGRFDDEAGFQHVVMPVSL